MKPREIRRNVYLVGAVDWDRRLFDALIPLPQGTSYNAYLVVGSHKTALLDTVDPSKWEELEAQLDTLPAPDYVVAHHGEQDHSGSLVKLIDKYPEAVIVANEKCKAELVDHLRLPAGRIRVIGDGETLDLGGKTLTFIFTPWVHWPETMCTWLPEDKLLFTCDFFGSHLATSDMYAREDAVLAGAKRYYAEIMMPFAGQVTKNLERVAQYEAAVICPSHGPLYDRPAFIVDLYREWASGAPRNQATLAYVSMHDTTRLLTDHLTAALVQRGVAVERFELSSADLGELAASLVDAATLLVGTPTVLTGPHPAAASAALLINALKPKARQVAVYGSYGWAGKAPEKLVELLSNYKGDVLDPVMVKGLPRDEDYAALDALADAVANRHQGLAPR
jgi:flavorubredoxin